MAHLIVPPAEGRAPKGGQPKARDGQHSKPRQPAESAQWVFEFLQHDWASQTLVKSASRRLSGRAVAPPAFPDPGNFLKMARLRNHGTIMQQKAHRGQFEAPAVVKHFWLIFRSCEDGVWPLPRHTVVSRTSILMEIPTRNNPLQRFGLGLRLRSQSQAISLKRRGSETNRNACTRRLTEAILKLRLWWSIFG